MTKILKTSFFFAEHDSFMQTGSELSSNTIFAGIISYYSQ